MSGEQCKELKLLGRALLEDEGSWGYGLCKLLYFGIHLSDQAFKSKNWEKVIENEVRMKGWKWLLPRMSFKGRVLVINNLVSSMLWHCLAYMDPPQTCCPGFRRSWWIFLGPSALDITFFCRGRKEDLAWSAWRAEE